MAQPYVIKNSIAACPFFLLRCAKMKRATPSRINTPPINPLSEEGTSSITTRPVMPESELTKNTTPKTRNREPKILYTTFLISLLVERCI